MGADNCPEWCRTVHTSRTEEHTRFFGRAASIPVYGILASATDSNAEERAIEIGPLSVELQGAEDLALLLDKLSQCTRAETMELAEYVRRAAQKLA